MAGQNVMCWVRFGFVLQREGAEQQWFGDHPDAQFHGWIACTPVVVAAYQDNFQLWTSGAPGEQLFVGRSRLGFRCMEKISEEDQALAGVLFQQSIEALQIRLGGSLWHRLAKSAIGSGLAEMNIGD